MPGTQQSDARRIPTPLAAGAVLAALALIWTLALDPSAARAAPDGSPESADEPDRPKIGVDAAWLRLLNGGEAAPLPGQRVCWG